MIRDRIISTVRKAGSKGHILNPGHSILPGTPEENSAYLFEAGKQVNDRFSIAFSVLKATQLGEPTGGLMKRGWFLRATHWDKPATQ